MVDFSVLGQIAAEENVSEAAREISRSLRNVASQLDEASDEAIDASTGFGSLSATAEVTSTEINSLEREVEGLNNELAEVSGTSAAALTGLSALGGATPLKGSAAESAPIDETILGGETTRRTLSTALDIPDPDFSEIAGSVESGDIDTLGELVKTLTQVSESAESTQETIRTLKDVLITFPKAGEIDGPLRNIDQPALPPPETQRSITTRVPSDIPDAISEPGPVINLAETIPTGENAIDARSLTGGGTPQKRLRDLANTVADVVPGLDSLAASQRDASNAGDESSDTFSRLRNVITKLLPELSSLSANIGPFTIGLSNLAVSVPALIATVGLLITVLGGLVTAILAVVAAFGAFFALGVLSFAEQLEGQFAGVTNRLEALEAIAKGAAAAFRDALAPLETANFAGLSAAEFFIRVFQDFIALVNAAAQVLAELLGLESVESFFFRIEEALLSANEAGGETISFIEGLTQAVNVFLPVITDFIVTLINGSPEALAFAASIGREILPALENFGASLLNVTVQLTRFGAIVAQTVLPVLATLLDVLGAIGATLVFISDTVPGVSAALLAFLATVTALTLSITVLVGAGGLLSKTLFTLSEALSVNAVQLAKLVGTIGVFVAGVVLAVDGAKQLLAAVGLLEPAVAALNSVVSTAVGFFGGFARSVDGVVGENTALAQILNVVIGLVKVITGLFIAYVSAASAYSTATALASSATLGFGGATAFANISLSTLIGRAATAAVGLLGIAASALTGSGAMAAFGSAAVGAITSIVGTLAASGLLPLVIGISLAIGALIVLIKGAIDVVNALLNPNEENADWIELLIDGMEVVKQAVENTVGKVIDLIDALQNANDLSDEQRQNIDGVGQTIFGGTGPAIPFLETLLEFAGASTASVGSAATGATAKSVTKIVVNSQTNGRQSDRQKIARTIRREEARRQRRQGTR